MPAYHHDFFEMPHRLAWQEMGDNLVATIDWLGEEV